MVRDPSVAMTDFRKQYDIAVVVATASDGPSVQLDYWTHRISPAQAEILADTLAQVITGVVSHSDYKIGQLDVVSANQFQKMVDWNIESTSKHSRFSKGTSTIHEIFQARASLCPTAPAVEAHDGQLTYRQLDTLSTQLSHHLVSIGVKTDTFVPYCFSKSLYTVVAVLGILKAGGAAVPLDPNHPSDRLNTILDDTNAAVVVTSPEHQQLFKHRTAAVVPVDCRFLDSLPEVSDLPCAVGVDSAALVVYTSGSTGKIYSSKGRMF